MDEFFEKDRRDLIRYPVKDTIFITFRPDFDRVGLVKDVNTSGLSFEYVSTRSHGCVEDVYVDIFSYKESYALTGVRCRVVYDAPVCDRPSYGHIGSRRCGLVFCKLSRDQSLKLKELIDEHTITLSSGDECVGNIEIG